MKTKIIFSLAITVLTRIESIWALFLLIFNNSNTKTEMEIENLIPVSPSSYWGFQIITIIVFFIIAWVVISYIQKTKKETIELLQNQIDFERNIFTMESKINSRKRKYLYKCMVKGKILPEPKSYLTDLEKQLIKEKGDALSSKLNYLYKEFDKKFEDEKE